MIYIKNGYVHTMTGKVIESGSIFVDKGKILFVGKDEDISPPNDCTVLDVKGKWVLPGLIESHCHIGISEQKIGVEGNDSNETTNPITPQLRALDAINPMDAAFNNAVRAGITSVMVGPGSSNVVGGQFLVMKTKGRCIDNLVIMEPAAMKIAFGENPKKNYSNQNMMPSNRMTIAAMLRQELLSAVQYKESKQKAMDNGEHFDIAFKSECWIPVLNGQIPLKAHVHRADDIQTAIRIAKEFNLRLTLDHCTEGHLITDEIKASGFPAIIGPSIASRNKPEVQYMDFKTAGILNSAGVKIAITTDHPVSLIQYLPICAGLAAREGLGVEEGLKAITINAAEICNISHRVGSIEVGKDADIAIYDGNPMEIFTKTLYTIIDGKIVFRKENEVDTSNSKMEIY